MVSAAEAAEHSSYTHQHIALLARQGKITARKSGKTWLIDLDSLHEYEQNMTDIGSLKHSPKPPSTNK